MNLILSTVDNLKITQRDIRHGIDLIWSCFRVLANRQLFDYSEQKIAIVDTGDGNLWIRDGLHRCCGIFLADREIHPSEYIIEHFTYDQLIEPNLSVKYYTPFDPRTEVRHEEFFDFKNTIENIESDIEKIEFIKNNSHLYKSPRMPHHETICDFVKYLKNKLDR